MFPKLDINSLLLALLAVFIGSVSQIILKKTASEYADRKFIQKFLNIKVIFAYGLMVLSTLMNVISLRKLDMRFAPAASITSVVWIYVMSYFFFKEKIGKFQLLGLSIMMVGFVFIVL